MKTMIYPWEKINPEDVDIDFEKLQALIEYCKSEESDELIIIKQGKLVCYENFTKNKEPIELNSLTKVFAGTAIGMLLEEGKIPSIFTPVSEYIPSWVEGDKANATVWHILTHTTGLRTLGHDAELSTALNCIEYAQSRTLENIPGTKSRCNNEAVALLAEIIRQTAGEDLECYLAERLFKPLSIKDWRWRRDASGNVYTYWGLALKGLDLAKFGQLYLNQGLWEGQRVLPQWWVEESTKPSQDIGPRWGYLWSIMRSDGKYSGFEMNGFDGKYLYVNPEKEFIGVRIVHRKSTGLTPDAEKFLDMVQSIALD
jgi:CubicO group peptidase (beta-lactamase class C family)